MRTISTRQLETPEEKSHFFALRYDYYVAARELDIAADHANRLLMDVRDAGALHFGTYAGEDIVGGFRAEIGAPHNLSFGADWSFGDFLHEMPPRVALFSGLCTSPHLRDERVVSHMVRESVALAKDFELPSVFFEMPPELWPDFHAAGLVRKGGALPDRTTGLKSAVFQLMSPPVVRPIGKADDETGTEGGYEDQGAEQLGRQRLAIVMGGRR